MDGGANPKILDKEKKYPVHHAAEQDRVPEGTSRPNKIYTWSPEEKKYVQLWEESLKWGTKGFYDLLRGKGQIQFYFNVNGSIVAIKHVVDRLNKKTPNSATWEE